MAMDEDPPTVETRLEESGDAIDNTEDGVDAEEMDDTIETTHVTAENEDDSEEDHGTDGDQEGDNKESDIDDGEESGDKI